jgi:hypothetical protein
MYRPIGPVMFVDHESTGLELPYLHGGRRIWEYAHIARVPGRGEVRFHAFVKLADLPFDPADRNLDSNIAAALDKGGFWERHPEICGHHVPDAHLLSNDELADAIAEAFDLPGEPRFAFAACNPHFDAGGLSHLLAVSGYEDVAPWNYRLVCAQNLAAGRLRVPAGWNPQVMAKRLGLDPCDYRHHTAMGDALFVRDLYDAVMMHPLRRQARTWGRRISRALDWCA